MSETTWVQSNWKFEELHGQTVEFKLPVHTGEVQGLGQFILTRGPNGQLSIDIRTVLHGDSPTERGTFNFHLNQWATDRIERHPNRSQADFRCIG